MFYRQMCNLTDDGKNVRDEGLSSVFTLLETTLLY